MGNIFEYLSDFNLRRRAGTLAATLLVASMLVSGCGGSAPAASATATPGGSAAQGTGVTAQATTTKTVKATATTAPSKSAYKGQIDATFGDGGGLTTDMGGTSEQPGGMVILPDDKIVVAGYGWPEGSSGPKFGLVRYNPDGSLDDSFGDGGKILTNVTGEEYDYAMAHAIALQPDGKMVVVGEAQNFKMYHHTFAMVRYNADGSVDESFGDNGTVLTPIGSDTGMGNEDVANAVAIEQDGKILVAGHTGQYFPSFAAARYNPDGSLDETFGDGGKVTTNFGFMSDAHSVDVQPDGKVMVSGYGGPNPDFTMVRYNVDGSPDKSFGADGIVTTDFMGGTDWANAMILRPDGKIILGGMAQDGNPVCSSTWDTNYHCDHYAFAIAQYNNDGSLDTGFGDKGKSQISFPGSLEAFAMMQLPNGQLLLAGNDTNADFAQVLYNADGSLDASFGPGGEISTDFGGGIDRAYAVGMQSNGRVVIVGCAVPDNETGDFDFGLAGYK